MAEQPSLRYFNVNYKECYNSIVGVLLLSQNTIKLFKNSILIQAQISVKLSFSVHICFYYQIMRFSLKLF